MNLLELVLTLYLIAVIIRIVLSWIPISYGSPAEGFAAFIHAITEPVLGPVRRLLPPVRLGAMALDLSPLVVIIGLQILIGLVR